MLLLEKHGYSGVEIEVYIYSDKEPYVCERVFVPTEIVSMAKAQDPRFHLSQFVIDISRIVYGDKFAGILMVPKHLSPGGISQLFQTQFDIPYTSVTEAVVAQYQFITGMKNGVGGIEHG